MQHQQLFYRDQLVFEHLILDQPFSKTADMPNEACFVYNVRGHAAIYTAQDSQTLGARSAVLMRCGQYLTRHLPRSPEGDFEILAVHFHPPIVREVLGQHLREALTPTPAPQRAMLAWQHDALLEAYSQNLLVYLKAAVPLSEELIALKFRELLLLLLQGTDAATLRSFLYHLFDPQQVAFKSVIDTHRLSGLSVPELAALAHLSVSSFKRQFQQLYQCPPGQYFKQQRLQEAAHLLRHTQQSITQIAYAVGYTDPSNFSKAFAVSYQMTPTQYRQQLD